jgi:hypothetical protein
VSWVFCATARAAAVRTRLSWIARSRRRTRFRKALLPGRLRRTA